LAVSQVSINRRDAETLRTLGELGGVPIGEWVERVGGEREWRRREAEERDFGLRGWRRSGLSGLSGGTGLTGGGDGPEIQVLFG